MKKLVLFLFAALLCSQAAFAQNNYDFSAVAPSGHTLYYSINGDGTVSVVCPSTAWIDYVPPRGDLVIPDSVTQPSSGITYLVTAIGDTAFLSMRFLTSVTIPFSVTSIGDCAFLACDGLTSMTIPNSVTSIGSAAFVDCYGLTSVTIPNSVTSIGSYAFYGCTGLTSVTIPNSVTRIDSSTFDLCSGLVSVTIPNSVTSIGGAAFNSCTSLTSVTIPNSVTSIGIGAFRNCGLTSVVFNADSCYSSGQTTYSPFGGCPSIHSFTFGDNVKIIPDYLCEGLRLTSVTIPDSVTSIGISAFYGTKLTSVTIPNSVTYIGKEAFGYCRSMTSVTISNSVTSIDESVFKNCTGLTSVTIPNSVTNISSNAFYGCTGLTSVTIGNSVTNIRTQAFFGCSGITSMKFLGQMPPQLGNDAFVGIPTDIPVYIPCGRLAYYVAQMPQFTNYVETMVGFSAMSENENMGNVQILTAPSCTDYNAVLSAVPNNGYRFDHWSTGSTDNPYTLTVTSDTTIIAYFVSDGTQGIGEVRAGDIRISVFNGRVCVEGITNEEVRVYDITGRKVQNHSLPSGVYIVKVGDLPAQKVVVMR